MKQLRSIQLGVIASICILSISSCKDKTHTTISGDSTSVVAHKSTLNLPEKSYNFFVIGDWGRSGEYNQKETGEQMNNYAEEFHPKFIISTGDNFYENGVASIDDPQWNSSFENVYSGANLQRDWYVILGNHDYRGNPQAEIDYSKKSRRWNMPSRYYSMVEKINDSVSILFVYLDTNPFIAKYQKKKERYADLGTQDTTKQLKWLDELLSNSKEKWKVVIGHHPVYSTGSEHGNTEEMLAVLKPRLEKYKVDLYLAGHEHDLQHQKPEGTVDYIVSGAGSSTRPTSKKEMTKFAEAVSGFAAFTCTSDSLTTYFINYKGDNIYSYSRVK